MRVFLRLCVIPLLTLALLPKTAAAQEPATLTGIVTNQQGAPIASASVFIVGMNFGTLTNAEGRYAFTVPASRVTGQAVTVTASLIGFSSRSSTVTLRQGLQTVNFTLAEDPLKLAEVVVTGQGTRQERRKLGVAINTVEGAAISRANETNAIAALAGKAPNVEITSNSGDPGSSAYIRIRGAASISGGTQPLFVVDGTPIDNSAHRIEGSHAGTVTGSGVLDLNTEDVENVEILKGAAAAALYGSRAANGVILITTKKGRPGQSRFTYRTTYTHDEVNATVPLQTRFGRGLVCGALSAAAQASRKCAPNDDISPNTPVTWGEELPPGTPIYDHANEVLQNGARFENNLTFSGGSERTTYYLSAGRTDHEGSIVGNQEYKRTTVRLKATHAFMDQLTIGGNFAYTDGAGDYIQHGSNISGIWLGALRTPPEFNNQPYIDPETGLHRSYRMPNPTTLAVGRGYDNPFWVANEITNDADVGRFFGNINADYSPFSWLTLNLTVGGDYRNDERQTLYPKSSSSFPKGQLIRANLVDVRYDESFTATATRQLTNRISGSLTLGQNMNHREHRRFQVDGSNLIFGTEQLDFVVTPTPNEYREVVRTDGYFGQAQVDLYDRLTLTGNLRLDGSNTFGRQDSRFLYPGLSASFRFQDLVGFDVLSFGRLRAAWGVTGRQPPVFSNISGFTKGFFGDGWMGDGIQSIFRGQEGVVREGTAGNPNIEPERETEFEGGLDLAFLNERVSLGVTYYNRKTEDAILAKPVPTSTGFFSRWENAASWTNHGWEATLDLFPVRSKNFSWSVGANWGRNRSCVLDLAGAGDVGLAGFTGSQVSLVAPRDKDDPEGSCYQWGVFFTDDFVRFGRGEIVDGVNIDATFPDASAGAIYIAKNGFPVYDADLNVTGDPNPDWTAGVRTSLTFFNALRVTGLLDIRMGQDAWNGTKGALMYFGTHKVSEPMHGPGIPHIFGCGDPNKGTATTCSNPNNVGGPGAGTEVTLNWNTWVLNNLGSGFTGPAVQYIEDASYVKLREISVAYTLPASVLTRFGFSAAEITLAGRNLHTWTDYTGIDPENNLWGNSSGRGIDYFNNPQTRSWVVGVSITR